MAREMNAAEIRCARALVSAFRAIAFSARAFDCERLEISIGADMGRGVRVRHPIT